MLQLVSMDTLDFFANLLTQKNRAKPPESRNMPYDEN
jgi:hypothetical protein